MPRDEWPPSALRASGIRCSQLAEKRLKSPQHESRWFNLAGFFLRPGRGFPLDEVRIKALWPIFHQGVKHTKDVQCWAEWWILWRRVAAGLVAAAPRGDPPAAGPVSAAGQGIEPRQESRPAQARSPRAGRDVALRRRASSACRPSQGSAGRCPAQRVCAAVARRPRLLVPGTAGRAGAALRAGQHGRSQGDRRALDQGPARAGRSPPGRETGDAIFALAQLARVANDRARDLDQSPARGSHRPPDRSGRRRACHCRPVREYHELESAQQVQALGDSLPIGLRLVTDASAGGSPV